MNLACNIRDYLSFDEFALIFVGYFRFDAFVLALSRIKNFWLLAAFVCLFVCLFGFLKMLCLSSSYEIVCECRCGTPNSECNLNSLQQEKFQLKQHLILALKISFKTIVRFHLMQCTNAYSLGFAECRSSAKLQQRLGFCVFACLVLVLDKYFLLSQIVLSLSNNSRTQSTHKKK